MVNDTDNIQFVILWLVKQAVVERGIKVSKYLVFWKKSNKYVERQKKLKTDLTVLCRIYMVMIILFLCSRSVLPPLKRFSGLIRFGKTIGPTGARI